MNRTQKKCFIAVTGFHLLLIVILFVGPAFLSPDKADDMTVIDFIPAKLIDAPFTGGGSPTANPPPTPTPPTPAPVQRQQQTQVTPPAPKPTPQVEKAVKPEPVKEVKKIDPDSLETKVEPKKRKVEVSTTMVTRSQADKSKQKPAPAKSESQNTPNPSKEFKEAARRIRQGASSSTEIEMPGVGGGGESYANYAQVVKSKYTQAWIAPDGVDDDEATAKISVTIARDGTVTWAKIIQSSGNAEVDRSVQATLDRVKFIAPFPEGSKDTERSYKINFNLKAKKLLG